MLIEMVHQALVAALVLVTVLPLSRAEQWWIRSLDFPRLQFLVLAVLLLLVQMLFCQYSPVMSVVLYILTVACGIYHLHWIFPYTPLVTTEVIMAEADTDAEKISIMCANVLTPNRNVKGLLALVDLNCPDLLVTLESDQWWEDQLAEIEDAYCFAVKCPLDNLFGMHVYSRLPLHRAEIKYLVDDEIPSIHCEVELKSGQRVEAHFIHPTPPVPEYSVETTERDAELIVVAKSVAESSLPVVVAGDLNDVAWSETTRLFRKISGLLDPRIGRGFYNTFHANYWFMRWPLDHLFHSSHFMLSQIRRLPGYGSDHFALYTELAYTPKTGRLQSGPVATNKDKEFAEDKIVAGDVSEKDVPGR